VAQVFVTPQALRDVDEAISALNPSDRVYVVAMHDGRAATSATAALKMPLSENAADA